MPSSLLCLCPSYLPYHHCCAFAYVTFHTIIAVSLHKLPSMPSSLLCLSLSYFPCHHHCCVFAKATFHAIIIAVSLHKLPSMPSSLRVTTLQPSSHPSPYTNRTPNASYGHAHLLSLNPLNTGAAISAIAVWTAAMPTSIPFCHIRTCLHPYPSDHIHTPLITSIPLWSHAYIHTPLHPYMPTSIPLWSQGYSKPNPGIYLHSQICHT